MRHLDPKSVSVSNIKENEEGIVDIVGQLK